MFYNGLPLYDREHERCCFYDEAFTKKELKTITKYCSTLELNQSVVESSIAIDKKVRNNKIAWLEPGNEVTNLIYGRIGWVVSKINAQFYRFDLTGMFEKIQYSEYYEGEHYDSWHTDNSSVDGNQSYDLPRKLSLSLLLSSPRSFKGGELQLMFSDEATIIKPVLGNTTIFPSYTLHRVTPVTKGCRKSLVVWVGGPPFK